MPRQVCTQVVEVCRRSNSLDVCVTSVLKLASATETKSALIVVSGSVEVKGTPGLNKGASKLITLLRCDKSTTGASMPKTRAHRQSITGMLSLLQLTWPLWPAKVSPDGTDLVVLKLEAPSVSCRHRSNQLSAVVCVCALAAQVFTQSSLASCPSRQVGIPSAFVM